MSTEPKERRSGRIWRDFHRRQQSLKRAGPAANIRFCYAPPKDEATFLGVVRSTESIEVVVRCVEHTGFGETVGLGDGFGQALRGRRLVVERRYPFQHGWCSPYEE